MNEIEKAIERMTGVCNKNVHTFVEELGIVLNYIKQLEQERDKYKSIIDEVREFITSEGSIETFRTIESREEWLKVHHKLLEILNKANIKE